MYEASRVVYLLVCRSCCQETGRERRRLEKGEEEEEEVDMQLEHSEVGSGGKSGSCHSFFIFAKRSASSAMLE